MSAGTVSVSDMAELAASMAAVDAWGDMLRKVVAPPALGTPAAALTERERLAVCIAAGVPITTSVQGSRLTVSTLRPCAVVDRGDGGYLVGCQK